MPFYFSDSNNLNFYSSVNGFKSPYEYLTKSSIVSDNLFLYFDAAESKTFSENYVSHSTYNASTWSDPLNGSTFTTGIDAPDGTNTAVRFTCNNTTSSLLRVSFPFFTPNGTDIHTISFYVRKISGTGNATTDLNDGSPNKNYTSELITNEWVRVTATGVPTATAKNFIDLFDNSISNYVLDFWGVQVERGMTASDYTPTTGTRILRDINLIDLSGNGNNGTRVNGVQYSSSNGGSLVFDGVDDYIQTSLIGRNTFLPISDFTMSIWVKFFRYPTSNNTTGCVFGAVNFQGYGIIWTGSTTNLVIGCVMRSSTVIRELTSPISINSWYNIVFSYSHSEDFTNFYVNGQLVGSTQASSGIYNSNLSTSYPISINRNWIYGGSFATQYFRGEVPQASIYSRALNSTEVQQNFDAIRQRFGV